MFNQGILKRQFAVFAAALLMSSIAVGAAVGPGSTGAGGPARPLVGATYA